MSNEISTLRWREEGQRRGDQSADLIEGTRTSRAQEGLQLGEGELDGIEVWAVRREKAEMRADRFDRGADVRLFVDGEIVEDNDIARA